MAVHKYEASLYGFLRRYESAPDYRGEVYFEIAFVQYDRVKKIYQTCSRGEAQAMWTNLCHLESHMQRQIEQTTLDTFDIKPKRKRKR